MCDENEEERLNIIIDKLKLIRSKHEENLITIYDFENEDVSSQNFESTILKSILSCKIIYFNIINKNKEN